MVWSGLPGGLDWGLDQVTVLPESAAREKQICTICVYYAFKIVQILMQICFFEVLLSFSFFYDKGRTTVAALTTSSFLISPLKI